MQLDLSYIMKNQAYIVAVSGGVDSTVLLHLITNELSRENNKIIVAHFDHGIRPDSFEDAELVKSMAKTFSLKFELGYGNLPKDASEADSRIARYKFLRSVQKKYHSKGVITAHHQDDVIETVVLNIIRGTGRKGLTSLRSKPDLIRPLLYTAKSEIVRYAKEHNLKWREDSTNSKELYKRNFVRLRLMPKISKSQRDSLFELVKKQTETNDEIDSIVSNLASTNTITRYLLLKFSHKERCEVLAEWLRAHHLAAFDKKQIERLSVLAVAAKPGTYIDLYSANKISINKHDVSLKKSPLSGSSSNKSKNKKDNHNYFTC